MPFAVLRTCYTAPCRAFADGERTYRIRWYRVPDERPFYEGLHAFWPGVDEMYTPSGNEMELVGLKPNPRSYYSGRDINERPGTHVHGDAEDFLGRSLTGKYQHFGQGLLDPCAEPAVLPGLAKFGLRVNEMHPSPLLKRGLKLGLVGDNMHVATPILPSLLALAVVFDELHPSPLLPPVGLGLGVVGVAIPVPVEVGEARFALGVVGLDAKPIVVGLPAFALGVVGLAIPMPVEVGELHAALGVVGLDVKPLFESLYTGLLLGRTETPYPRESANVGALLGLIGQDVEAGIETLGAVLMLRMSEAEVSPEVGSTGVALGVVGVDVGAGDEALETDLGLALGVVGVDIEDVPTGPGADCSSAGLTSFGTPFGATISPFTEQWFKMWVTGGVLMHATLTAGFGPGTLITLKNGATCGTASTVGTFSISGQFVTFTPSVDSWLYFKAENTGFGGWTYSIATGTGAGP